LWVDLVNAVNGTDAKEKELVNGKEPLRR
jgi:hypothetical protein